MKGLNHRMSNGVVAFLLIFLILSPSLGHATQGVIGQTDPEKGASWFSAQTNYVVEALFYALFAIIRINPCVVGDAVDECAYFPGQWFAFNLVEDTTVQNINVNLLKMFIPLYVTLFILLGVYLIFMQGSVRGRAEGKSMLLDIFIGLVLVSLSPLIFQTLLNISGNIVDSMAASVSDDIANLQNFFGMSGGSVVTTFCLLTFGLVFALLAILVALLRYFVVMVCAAIFPLGLFLWSFRLTKGMGSAIINFSLAMVFTQVFQMGFLVIGISFAVASGSGIMNSVLMFSSFLAIVLTPIIVSKILPWIGGSMHAYSSRGGGTFSRAVGLMMQGQSFGTSILSAGGRYQATHTMGLYVRGGERPDQNAWRSHDVGGGRILGYGPGGSATSAPPDQFSKRTPNFPSSQFMALGYAPGHPGRTLTRSTRNIQRQAQHGASLSNATPKATYNARAALREASVRESESKFKLDQPVSPLDKVHRAAIEREAQSAGVSGNEAVGETVDEVFKESAVEKPKRTAPWAVTNRARKRGDLESLKLAAERRRASDMERERILNLDGEDLESETGLNIPKSPYVGPRGKKKTAGASITESKVEVVEAEGAKVGVEKVPKDAVGKVPKAAKPAEPARVGKGGVGVDSAVEVEGAKAVAEGAKVVKSVEAAFEAEGAKVVKSAEAAFEAEGAEVGVGKVPKAGDERVKSAEAAFEAKGAKAVAEGAKVVKSAEAAFVVKGAKVDETGRIPLVLEPKKAVADDEIEVMAFSGTGEDTRGRFDAGLIGEDDWREKVVEYIKGKVGKGILGSGEEFVVHGTSLVGLRNIQDTGLVPFLGQDERLGVYFSKVDSNTKLKSLYFTRGRAFGTIPVMLRVDTDWGSLETSDMPNAKFSSEGVSADKIEFYDFTRDKWRKLEDYRFGNRDEKIDLFTLPSYAYQMEAKSTYKNLGGDTKKIKGLLKSDEDRKDFELIRKRLKFTGVDDDVAATVALAKIMEMSSGATNKEILGGTYEDLSGKTWSGKRLDLLPAVKEELHKSSSTSAEVQSSDSEEWFENQKKATIKHIKEVQGITDETEVTDEMKEKHSIVNDGLLVYYLDNKDKNNFGKNVDVLLTRDFSFEESVGILARIDKTRSWTGAAEAGAVEAPSGGAKAVPKAAAYHGRFVGVGDDGKAYVDDDHRASIADALEKGGVTPSKSLINDVSGVLMKHEEVERTAYADAIAQGVDEKTAKRDAHTAGMIAEVEEVGRVEGEGNTEIKKGVHAVYNSFEAAPRSAEVEPGQDAWGMGELGMEAEGAKAAKPAEPAAGAGAGAARSSAGLAKWKRHLNDQWTGNLPDTKKDKLARSLAEAEKSKKLGAFADADSVVEKAVRLAEENPSVLAGALGATAMDQMIGQASKAENPDAKFDELGKKALKIRWEGCSSCGAVYPVVVDGGER